MLQFFLAFFAKCSSEKFRNTSNVMRYNARLILAFILRKGTPHGKKNVYFGTSTRSPKIEQLKHQCEASVLGACSWELHEKTKEFIFDDKIYLKWIRQTQYKTCFRKCCVGQAYADFNPILRLSFNYGQAAGLIICRGWFKEPALKTICPSSSLVDNTQYSCIVRNCKNTQETQVSDPFCWGRRGYSWKVQTC